MNYAIILRMCFIYLQKSINLTLNVTKLYCDKMFIKQNYFPQLNFHKLTNNLKLFLLFHFIFPPFSIYISKKNYSFSMNAAIPMCTQNLLSHTTSIFTNAHAQNTVYKIYLKQSTCAFYVNSGRAKLIYFNSEQKTLSIQKFRIINKHKMSQETATII